MPIKIIIADDHQLFREGLATLLGDTGDIEIVAQAQNGLEAIDQCINHNPDIVLMDISMPGIDGVEATRRLTQELHNKKVIALSMHSERQYIKKMFEAGASGYLFKNCTYTELTAAIHSVYQGNKYLSNEITEIVIQDYLDKNEITSITGNDLTEREFEILKLIAEGFSVSDISEKLFVSVKTVGTHRQHILEKLNLKSTSDIVKFALKNNIITLD